MHWTQTPNGRKRMSKIQKARYAEKRAAATNVHLDAVKEDFNRSSRITPEMTGIADDRLSLSQAIFDLEIAINHKVDEIEKLKYTFEYLRALKTDA